MAPALHISIPATSTATPSDGKAYTLYHVVLQLPLRKHEIKKRYNDFVDLNNALQSQTGLSPPASLPAKSWLWRTVNNETMTEERRQGLEKYLRIIIESDDARWRSSSAWRTFLNLPSGTNAMRADGSFSKSQRRDSAGGIKDPNQWLDVHRELKTQIQTARQQLKQREAATTAQAQHSLSADAKSSLVRAAAAITQLGDGLKSVSDTSRGDDGGWGSSKRLGDGEIRRRRDLLGAAKKEVEGLEGVLRSMATKTTSGTTSSNFGAAATAGDKEALFENSTARTKPSGRVLGGPPKETERTRELDNTGVVQLQKQYMQEQDEDVLVLGKTVAKLKDMGIMMDEELTIQNTMLGLLEGDADRVQSKVNVARDRIGKLSKG